MISVNQILTATNNQLKKANIYGNIRFEGLREESVQNNDIQGPSRFTNGGLTECAVVESFGFNWSPYTYGGGGLNNIPDLLDCNLMLGVKSKSTTNSWKIPKRLHSDELCCTLNKYNNTIEINGILTQSVLDRYGNDDLLFGELKDSGKKKTGFDKLEYLLPITLDNLERYRTHMVTEQVFVVPFLFKSAVYIERLNDDFIAYVILNDGKIVDEGIIKFNYSKGITDLKDFYALNGFIEKLNNRYIFTFGMTNVVQQLKVFNEKQKYPKNITCKIVDMFQILCCYYQPMAINMDYRYCRNSSEGHKINLISLMKHFKLDNELEDILKHTNVYHIRMCEMLVYTYVPLIKKLAETKGIDISKLNDMTFDKLLFG